MKLRFLIDECLTPELAQMAVEAGYEQSTSVLDRGWRHIPDAHMQPSG